MLARPPLNFKSKIGRRKSEAHNFCRKREVVATGKQVMVVATKQRLSLFGETQMDRVRGLPYLAFLTHGRRLPYRGSTTPYIISIVSNLRAIDIFSLCSDELPAYAGTLDQHM